MGNSKLRMSIGLFGITFFYVLLTGCLVQFFVLPYLFPDLHAGDGLLKGVDTVGFHHEALKLLAQMNMKGWSVWSLRPDGMNSPIGLMAAMYYLLVPKPFVLLILNGFLWGITAVTWYAILERIFPENGKWSAIPVMLMVSLPSSLQWTSQFHKDLFFITGYSLVFYAYLHSALYNSETTSWVKSFGSSVLLIVVGSLLIWVVRPYMLQLVVASTLVTLPVAGLAYLLGKSSRGLMTTTLSVIVVTLLLSLVGNYVLPVKDSRHDRLNLTASHPVASVPDASVSTAGNSVSHFFNYCVLSLMKIREGYCGSKDSVGSAIDCDIKINNTSDAITYLPRALEIALLSPFPHTWFAKAKTPGGAQMRVIAGGEMVVAYMIFSLTFILMVSGRAKLSLSLILGVVYLLMPLLIETYANPEVGTLYRMRYIFWTGLLAMSLSLIISYLLFQRQTGKVKSYKLKSWRNGLAN